MKGAESDSSGRNSLNRGLARTPCFGQRHVRYARESATWTGITVCLPAVADGPAGILLGWLADINECDVVWQIA